MHNDLLTSIIDFDGKASAPSRLRLITLLIEAFGRSGSAAEIAGWIGCAPSAAGDVISLGESLSFITRSAGLSDKGKPCLRYDIVAGAPESQPIVTIGDAVAAGILDPDDLNVDLDALPPTETLAVPREVDQQALRDAGIPESASL